MYLVRASELNLRSSPRVVTTNRIGLLPRGHAVELVEKARAPWWKVRTELGGTKVEGYVSSDWLTSAGELPRQTPANRLVEVHLQSKNPVKRSQDGGRASPLNEPDAPRRKAGSAAEHARQLLAIVGWLRVDRSVRYLPTAGSTYCNIYSYDYCCLGSTYLPRVWWTATALRDLDHGVPVEPVYAATVRELNANSLHHWLPEFGARFGWRREFDLSALQQAANEGAVCIISAQHVDANRSGHICPVVPESGSHRADRRDGRVRAPLQSNAGRVNFQFGAPLWWTSSKLKSSSFWIHD
ncbi:SH3 domain-containing protein [Luteimonas viscosa]|uniref:SH3 domain-containing protein n=1 Tax=Luteimonas viscosa TaxID=1132694 RepID=A0A5D4XJV2_9GAMM|nr:SH3 domain-containing protein [Luteimonas viscosa]TYT24958.1 SH3 domain-containing protein [Luteimonas viscosa]